MHNISDNLHQRNLQYINYFIMELRSEKYQVVRALEEMVKLIFLSYIRLAQ